MKKPTLYFLCLALILAMPMVACAQKSRKIKAKFTWEIGNAHATESIVLNMLVPTNIEGRQKVNSVKFSIPPVSDETKNGDRYVRFVFTAPNIPKILTMEADMETYKDGLSTRRLKKTPPADPNAKNYLGSEQYILPDHPKVKAVAEGLKKSSPEETVKNICTYLADNLKYDNYPRYDRQGNVLTLEKMAGVCGDYSDLMIALCRANGIPARLSGGYMVAKDFLPGWDGDVSHVWVDVYLEDYGWFPVEPTRNSAKGWQTFETRYVYMSQDINNSELTSTYNYTYKGWRPRIDRFFSAK